MAKLFNLARMTTATVGAGSITLAVAVAGCLTFAQAGVANGDTVTYGIKDGSNSEVGEGVYTSGTLVLTRTPISSTNANAAIVLSGTAEVFITPSHKHFFDQGTAIIFQQTAAPTGWTKQTTHNDKALRVVSGAASSGGTNAFSTVMAQTVVGGTTLSTAQLASHNHSADPSHYFVEYIGSGAIGQWASGSGVNISSITANAGSGTSHNHSITMAMQYVDVIVATKD